MSVIVLIVFVHLLFLPISLLFNYSRCYQEPKLDDLNRSVRPKVARRWRDLGIELLSAVENGVEKLDIIRENNPRDVEACCTEMFQFWLDNANDASWRKLVEAVKIIGYNVLAKDLEEVSVYVFNIV